MADIVKSVEQIDLTIAANETTVSGFLSSGQDYTNCVPFMTLKHGSDTQASALTDIYFSGTTESGVINFERAVADVTYDVDIACSVVEFYPSEVHVQQGEITSVGNTATAYTTASGFDQDKTAMVFYWKSSSTSDAWSYHLVRGRVLSNGTQVDFYRYSNTGNITGHYFLFEDLNDNFDVIHDDFNISSNSQQQLDFVMDGRQLFLTSWATSYTGNYSSRTLWRMLPKTAGFLDYYLYSTGYTSYHSIQILTFTGNKIHSLLDAQLSAYNSTSKELDFILSGVFSEAIDYDSLSVFSSNPYGLSATDSTSAGVISDVFTKHSITSSGIVQLEKASAGANYSASVVNAISWNGYGTISGTNSSPLDSEEAFVKSVENGIIEIEDGVINVVYALTKGQDISNCLVLKSESFDGNDNHSPCLVNAFFTAENLLWFRRGGNNGTLTISFSVVEFYTDQVSVEQGFFPKPGNVQEHTKTVSTMDLNKTFLVANHSSGSIGSEFGKSLVRAAITDTTTLQFYRYTNNSSTPLFITYFIVKDLTDDNFYVDNYTESTTSNNIYHYTDYNFPVNNTIFFSSYSSAYSGEDGDDSLFRSFYVGNSLPVHFTKQSNGYTSAIYSAAVHIKRSNRKYVQPVNLYFSGSPKSETISVDPDFVTHSGALSLVHPSMISAARTTNSISSSLKGALYRGELDEGSMEFTISADVVDGYQQYSSFYLVDWLGYGDYTSDYDSTKTSSTIESIELVTLSGTWQRIESPLTRGQDASKCVPFATWATDTDDTISKQFYKFNFYENPKKVVVHTDTQIPADNSYVDMNLYVVEFGKNIAVQTGDFYLDHSTTSLEVDLDTEIVMENSFMIFYYNAGGSSGTSWSTHMLSGRISSTSTLQFERYDAADNLFIQYFVIECFNGEWEVAHKTAAATSAATISFDVPDLMARPKSLLLGSVDTSYTGDDADDSCFKLYPNFTNHSVDMNRYSSGYTSSYPCCQVVTFNNDTAFVDFYEKNIPSGQNTADQELGVSVDLKRSIIFNGQAMNFNATNQNVISNFTQFKYSLIDEDNAQISKLPSTGYVSEVAYQVITFPEYKTHYVEGTVVEQDLFPVERTVRMYRLDTGALMDEAVSASGTGYFRLETSYSGAHYVACFDDNDLPDYNDLIYGKIYPTVISGCFSHNMGWV